MKQKRWGRGEEGRRQLENFRPPPYRFLFRSRFSFRVAELLYAPINGLPQDGEGGGDGLVGNPREIWHFQVSNVNFPTLEFPLWVKFMPLLRTKEPVIICRRGRRGGDWFFLGGNHTVFKRTEGGGGISLNCQALREEQEKRRKLF